MTPCACARDCVRDKRKRNETKRKYPSTIDRRIAWTVCDGTDASFEMIRGIAREPQKTHIFHASVSFERRRRRRRRMDATAMNERTRKLIEIGTHTDAKPTFHAMHHSTRRARVIHGPVVWVDPKNLIRCPCVHVVLVVVVFVTADVDPSIDRSIGLISFRFYASSRSSIGSRAYLVRAPRDSERRMDPSASSRKARARERIGESSLELFTHTFGVCPSVRFW